MRRSGVTVALGFAAFIAVSTSEFGIGGLQGTGGRGDVWPIAWEVAAVWAQGAQGFGSAAPGRFFRVEAEGAQGRGGRPIVRGYVNNSYGVAADRVLLQVETLDASGQVVARTLLPVDGTVPGFGRQYFEGPVSAAGAKYNVTVYYYEWLHRGGGGS